MATKGVPLWSKTAASNATADPAVNYAEGQSPPTLNDSARAAMASVAGWRDDLYGLTTAGTSTAYTVTTNSTFASASDMSGVIFTIIPHTTCGSNPSLAVDGLTSRPLNSAPSTAVTSGTLVSGTPYIIKYVHATTEFIVLGIAGSGSGGTASNSFATIAVSGQFNVVADSATDTLTLIAGTGVTLSTDPTSDAITIAASTAASDSFKTIAVSGQSDVVADSSTDTLTLVAGTGIAITTSAAGDSVTITNSNTGSSIIDTDGTLSGNSDTVAPSEQAVREYIAANPNFAANKGGTNQTGVADNTATKITFTTELHDVGGFYDAGNSKWTPPAGYAFIGARLQFAGSEVQSGAVAQLSIYKNGSLYANRSFIVNSNQNQGLEVSTLLAVNGSDYFEVYALHDASGAGTWTASGTTTFSEFYGHMVART